jgi:hypothetical protein
VELLTRLVTCDRAPASRAGHRATIELIAWNIAHAKDKHWGARAIGPRIIEPSIACVLATCADFWEMARRNEHASTVLTSNMGFEEWGEVFGDEVMAAALIDRLVHHCHIVTVRGNSYRMRQHTDLWHALHTPDPEPTSTRRRRPRQEAATN